MAKSKARSAKPKPSAAVPGGAGPGSEDELPELEAREVEAETCDRGKTERFETDVLATLREAVASAKSGKSVAVDIHACLERLNELFEDAALLGLKLEFEIGETYLNVLHDEHAHKPAPYIKCKVFAEMTGS